MMPTQCNPMRLANTATRIAFRMASDPVARLLTLFDQISPLRGSAYSALLCWLAEARRYRPPPRAPRVAVHVLRNRYWAEWAAFTCCRLLRDGFQPVLTYSGKELRESLRGRPVLDPDPWKFWKAVTTCEAFPSVDIDTFVPHESSCQCTAEDDLTAAAHISLAYDGLPLNARTVATLKSELQRYVVAYRGILSDYGVNHCICPSGLIGTSAAVLRGCTGAGIRVVTVEGWGLQSQHMTWNVDAPALHFDIAGWMAALGTLDEQQEAVIDTYMRLQEEPRSAGGQLWSGYRMAQRIPVDARLPPAVQRFLDDPRPLVLVGTNVVGDSVTLGRNTIFADQLEWIDATLDWVRKQENVKLVVRVHPEEHIHTWAQPLAQEIHRLAQGLSNVLVIHPEDPVNTFALVRLASCGTVWVSNLGADMIARGVPTILAARPHYHGIGIGQQPSSRSEYLDMLARSVAGDLTVSPAERERALRYIYIFTRLVSMRGNPLTGVLQLPRLDTRDADIDFFYSVLEGKASRADVVARDKESLMTATEAGATT